MSIAVSSSLPDPNALAELVVNAYGLGPGVPCSLISPGVNDTYQVGDSYFYRVYRAGWRSRSEIAWELALLLHLQQAGVPVSVPVARTDGLYITDLAAPEGVRPAVLFTRAPGKVLDYAEEDAFQYGCTAGRLHNAMDTFQTEFTRFRLDLDHLLEQPLRCIQPFAVSSGHWRFLSDLAGRLRSRVQAVADQLEPGICHGDLHGHNVHKAEDGRQTLFDFDCGGPGWRAYDLAVYRWAVGRHARSLAPWEAFLRGYRTLREVRQADLEIIPVFVAIRLFWLLGLHAGQVNQRGTASVHMWVEGATQALRQWAETEG